MGVLNDAKAWITTIQASQLVFACSTISIFLQPCYIVTSTLYLQSVNGMSSGGSFVCGGRWADWSPPSRSVGAGVFFMGATLVVREQLHCSSNAGTSSFHGHYKRLMEGLSSSLWTGISKKGRTKLCSYLGSDICLELQGGRKRAQRCDCNV